MDITNYFKEQGGADPQKKSDKEVPVEEPEIDTGDERNPEVEEILFEEESSSGEDEVAEPVVIEDPILVDERVDEVIPDEDEIEIVGQEKELGRPSKLDEETIKKLNAALRVGLSQKKSAIYAGIGETTFYRWQRRFNEIDEACQGDPDNIGNVEDLELWDFWQSIKKAKVTGEISHLGVISKAAENGVWQASAWFLERSNPEEWGKRDRNQLEDGQSEDTVKVIIKYSS
jgi:hypothetical protein